MGKRVCAFSLGYASAFPSAGEQKMWGSAIKGRASGWSLREKKAFRFLYWSRGNSISLRLMSYFCINAWIFFRDPFRSIHLPSSQQNGYVFRSVL